MSGLLAVLYGVFAYAVFLPTFLYAVGFIGNLVVPKTIDSGVTVPLPETLAVNLALLGAFALQHSVMARPGFKRWWTRIVPKAVERSTYVLLASLVLALLMWQWRPIPSPVIWHVSDPFALALLNVLFWVGWAVLLLSTFLINHFELFGLRQVFARLLRREIPAPSFHTPLFYKYVRHPLYVGFMISFWSTPHMTAGHLLFSAGATAYILVGIWFEERDLLAEFGDRYRVYRGQVGMLFPFKLRKRARAVASSR